MKKIQFFLVTENDREENEYLQLSDFVGEINPYFERVYRISVELLTMEELNAPEWQQEEYRRQIRESEAVFFLLFMSMEEAIEKGFDAAWDQYRSSGKPAIYTYFYNIDDQERDEPVRSFMRRLDEELGHFYSNYDHIDTIKLRLLELLKLQEMNMLEMTVRGGCLVMDGRKVMSLENVKLFSENDQLKAWKAELEEVERKYYPMKARYKEFQGDAAACREYAALASRRQFILDSIEETEKMLFRASLNMVQDMARGEITVRQREAYRLLEQGDSEGANRILDAEEIKNDYRRKRQKLKEEAQQLSRVYIRELRTKIDVLETMIGYPERFEEITDCYEEIMKAALEDGVEYDEVQRYASFLNDQGRSRKALEVARTLESVYEQEDVSEEDKAILWNLLGIITSERTGMQKDSEKYYSQSRAAYEKLAEENPERYLEDVAMSYNNAGIFYNDQGQPEKAEDYYRRAIEIREKLAKENPERYLEYVATSYNNAGIFYKEQSQPKKAEDYYLRAIEIYEKLADENPERYQAYVAMSYNNTGNFYADQGQPEKAEDYYRRAIEIREKLAEKNPERYAPDLAASYFNYAIFKQSGVYFAKALEIAQEHPWHPYCRQIIDILP